MYDGSSHAQARCEPPFGVFFVLAIVLNYPFRWTRSSRLMMELTGHLELDYRV